VLLGGGVIVIHPRRYHELYLRVNINLWFIQIKGIEKFRGGRGASKIDNPAFAPGTAEHGHPEMPSQKPHPQNRKVRHPITQNHGEVRRPDRVGTRRNRSSPRSRGMTIRGNGEGKMEASATADRFRPPLRNAQKQDASLPTRRDKFRLALHRTAGKGAAEGVPVLPRAKMAACHRDRGGLRRPIERQSMRRSGFHCGFIKVSPYCGRMAGVPIWNCRKRQHRIRAQGMSSISDAIPTNDQIELLPHEQIEPPIQDQTRGRPDENRAGHGFQDGNQAADRMIAKQTSGETSLDSFEAARRRFFT
jgi:hypothetical protein